MSMARAWPLLLTTTFALTPTPASANDTVWFSPGIKLGYTFGEGFTVGLELSVVHVPDVSSTDIGDLLARGIFVGYGGVLNWDWTPAASLHKVHLGAQWTGPAIGLEVGPSVVFDDQGTYFGVGVSPWALTYAIPYYNYTLVFGRQENLHEIGVHLKLHLCSGGIDACGDGDDFDFDFDDFDD